MPRHTTPRLLLLVLLFALTGCLRRETAILPHEAGNVTTGTVSLDPTYKYQVYYSLATNTAISQNYKAVWDLGFQATAAGWRITLNTSKSMFAMYSGKTDFAAVTPADSAGFSAHKRWDASAGQPDSTAIGDWRGSNKVYIIDRGFNELGQPLGFHKVQFLHVTDSAYTLRLATLSGAGDTTITIAKDSTYALAFLSFTGAQQLQVQPPLATWDLAFTQYTYVFYDEVPVTPYLVTGCLLAPGTQAVLDTVHTFAQVTFALAGGYTFTDAADAIGYNWKVFNGTTYTINTRYTYIIRTAAGLYYKLHFIGFYNTLTGAKGNPQWEYQQL